MHIDSPILSFGTKVTNLLILNFYWIIGCLPLITFGTSTIAAFSVMLKMVEDREGTSMTIQFWKAYVNNLRHGIPLSMFLLAGTCSIWLDVRLIQEKDGSARGLLLAAVVMLLLLIVHFLYLFPLEARYCNTLIRNLSNARTIFLTNPGRSFGLTGILLMEFLLTTQTLLWLRASSWLFVPILMIYTVSKFAMPVFRELEDSKNEPAHD